jgi:NAD(P)-dependent dehydrogenase (short-subunit alcohol dehydrogenase family)
VKQSLQGKVVLVTGASRGIGAATATELARRGARVSTMGIEADLLRSLNARLGDDHAWFEADVTEQAGVAAAVAGTVERFGRIDAIVANAGVVNYGTVRTADPDAFARTVDVNLSGVYRTIAAALPHLMASGGYALVIASVAALAPLPGAGAYAASKAGLDQLVRGMRVELAGSRVALGIAYPCWVDTDMVRQAEDAIPSFRKMRGELPWPIRVTSPVGNCAAALANAVERRSRRVYFPRWVALIAALRPLITSSFAESVMMRRTSELMPRFDAEVEALNATEPIEQGS